jgi:hypothetical protein
MVYSGRESQLLPGGKKKKGVRRTAETNRVVITFKVPDDLAEAMKGITNRSEFICNAILSALGNLCLLCKGSGILLPNQQEHWNRFAQDHTVEECEDCNALHLVCKCGAEDQAHP